KHPRQQRPISCPRRYWSHTLVRAYRRAWGCTTAECVPRDRRCDRHVSSRSQGIPGFRDSYAFNWLGSQVVVSRTPLRAQRSGDWGGCNSGCLQGTGRPGRSGSTSSRTRPYGTTPGIAGVGKSFSPGRRTIERDATRGGALAGLARRQGINGCRPAHLNDRYPGFSRLLPEVSCGREWLFGRVAERSYAVAAPALVGHGKIRSTEGCGGATSPATEGGEQ